MSEQYKPVKGDRVRVVLEGEVFDSTRSYGTYIRDADGITSFVAAEHVVSVEKIEPPVEVFKPGDVVRLKGGKLMRLITNDGWVAVGKGWTFPGTYMDQRREFTSDRYEKVSLG